MPSRPPRRVPVSFDRLEGWLDRYDAAHPDTAWAFGPSEVQGRSGDATLVRFDVPFAPLPDLSRPGLVDHLRRPWRSALLLVRKGGFAVARLEGSAVLDVKVGKRHVQGRTKAGGWSQQRFARRRDNQARAAYDAAAQHAHQMLGPHTGRLDLVAVGGDRQAVAAVLGHAELAPLGRLPQRWLGAFPDPSRQVLDAAVERLLSVEIEITDPPETG